MLTAQLKDAAHHVLMADAADWSLTLTPERRNLTVTTGCSEEAMRHAETVLGRSLPRDLASLMSYSNGLVDASAESQVVWPLSRLVTDNLKAWASEDLALPAALLGFGDDGSGDWFCMRSQDPSASILHWSWIDGAARPIAHGLRSFLPRWLDGDLTA